MKLTAPALAGLVLLAACSPRPPPFPPPPALPVVKIPLPPVSDVELVWQPGDWTYSGGSYHYDPGRYIPAEGHSLGWVFGHWSGARGHFIWVPGGWMVPGMR